MKFCGQCGAPLQSVCRSCGAANPPENRFCGHCGVSLDGPPLEHPGAAELYTPRPRPAPIGTAKEMLPGEMKQVSVLFCDIVNSTPLTERLGPEAMRDLVSAFLETSLAEVQRYGGTAPQFTGDGFLALFGAPLTHEDHVRRALLAALAIRRALGGEEETGARERLNLPVRIGIHSGPVIFGSIGDRLPMDHTVIGDTANVAARLQQAADPGTILLSEATRVLAEGSGFEPSVPGHGELCQTAAIAPVVISDPVFCRLRITESATRDWHVRPTYSSGGQYVNPPAPRTVSGSNQRRMGDCPVGAALSLH